MTEYIEIIDREELINDLNKFTPEEFKALVNMLILNRPAADVQEVRHGKNTAEANPVDKFECSECGIIFEDLSMSIYDEYGYFSHYKEFEFKFCPNCGAKIDIAEQKDIK